MSEQVEWAGAARCYDARNPVMISTLEDKTLKPPIPDEPMPETTSITVSLSREEKERVERLAALTQRPVQDVAREAIRGFLDWQEREVGKIRVGLEAADAGDFVSPDEVRDLFARWVDDGPLDDAGDPGSDGDR